MEVEKMKIQKINPQQIKKIENNKITNPPNKRKNSKKKKLLISKTLSMETISTGQKYTARQKSAISGKLFNNSAEDFDYLNFSDIDIDLIKKISSCEKDIFKPELYPKNQDNNNDIVQNRYNMIDTSFDTNKQEEIINKSVDEYVDINNNTLIKTPSTICNYYDIDSAQKNIKNNVIKEKKKKKQIKISNNCVLNYNNPIYTHRIKQPKHYSSSNIKVLQNSKRKYNNTNTGLYKNKKSAMNINSNRTRIKPKEIMTPITKDKNKVIHIQTNNNNNKINSQQKIANNNLVKSYIESNKKNNNKTNSNKNKKYLSIKQYSDYISSQVIKRDKQDKKNSNCNFTFNNDITQLLKKKKNIPDLYNSINEIKENININLNQNTLDESRENKNTKKQKPIMLYLNKPKYNSYFKTPKCINSEKKGKKCLNSVENHKGNNLENNNTIIPDYTGRNYQKSCETTRRDIVVIRKKKKNKSCLINDCTKSISSKIDADIANNNSNSNKINITFHNYINDCLDKPIIKVNLKKHIKSSSQLIKFINVNSKSIKSKTKENTKTKNSGSSNKSFVNSCLKNKVNPSQLIKELLTKRQLLKSPTQSKNNNSMLKISKTSKENSALFINRTKSKITTSNKTKKIENNSSIQKKILIGNNNTKKFYSRKFENTKNNESNKLDRNTKNKIFNKNAKTKNYIIPKTSSDIKVNKFNKKEENKENILINENEEYGMEKRVKQKLIDRMNRVTKNTFGNIWGNKKKNDSISEIIKSPFINKEYSNTHKNFYNKRIISNENSKIDEKDYKYDNNIIERRNQIEFKIIKDYKGAQTFTNNFFNS